MEVSEDDLTDAPHMDGVDAVIAVNQALKFEDITKRKVDQPNLNKCCIYPKNIRQANSQE